jgi:hypothetical protein
MLREISQGQKAKYCMFLFVETKLKIVMMMMMMMMMMIGHECERGTV